MSVNFSPIYGESPTGTRLPINVDANGNLIVTSGGGSAAPDNVNIVQVNGSPISASNPVPVAPNVTTSSTSTLTSVASSATTVSLLASNTSRKGAYFYNDSTAILYLAFAATSSTTAYTLQIPANGFYEMPPIPVYTGAIAGIWSAANGNARITELS